MPEGAKERGVGLSGSLECVSNVERLIFEKLNARRTTSLAPSPAEVRACPRERVQACLKLPPLCFPFLVCETGHDNT